jgi:thioredoxin 1
MSVIHVNTDEEFQELVEKHETCLVDFSASWCGPCRMIAPFYEQQAAENPKIKFLKVDVDELEKVAQSANIRAM